MVNGYRPAAVRNMGRDILEEPWFLMFREKYGTKPHKFLPLRGKNKNLK
jgi:hypothetical protein